MLRAISDLTFSMGTTGAGANDVRLSLNPMELSQAGVRFSRVNSKINALHNALQSFSPSGSYIIHVIASWSLKSTFSHSIALFSPLNHLR